MYKACVFDLDGTLTDTLESLTFSVNKTLKEIGLGQISAEQCRSFVGNGAAVLVEKSIRAAGDPGAEKLEEAKRTYAGIFGEFCTYKVKPYDGIPELLESLKAEGIRMAVVSNKPHEQTKDVVRTFFAEGTFDEVQGQSDKYPRKPDPSAVYAVLERMGVSPEEAVYVGDSEVDMKTGKAAGMLTVGVTWGFRSEEVLLETGADRTIDHAAELLKLF